MELNHAQPLLFEYHGQFIHIEKPQWDGHIPEKTVDPSQIAIKFADRCAGQATKTLSKSVPGFVSSNND